MQVLFCHMGWKREAFDPGKHVQCARGWHYDKILPPHMVEAHLKSATHSMHAQTTNQKASITHHYPPYAGRTVSTIR